jgi:hypothetical protein
MAIRDTEQTSAGRHIMRLEGAPRLVVLDAAAVAIGDIPDEAVLKKLALLAASEHADVLIRGVSTGLQQPLERWQARKRISLQTLPATQAEPLSTLLAQRSLAPDQALIFLVELLLRCPAVLAVVRPHVSAGLEPQAVRF